MIGWGLRCVLVDTVAVAFIAFSTAASGDPTMSVTPSVCDDGCVFYRVVNTSTNLGSANNLIYFVVPAGTNQGVCDAVSEDSTWSYGISANETTFFANGVDWVPPGGGMDGFYVWSTVTTLGRANARALAADDDPFNEIQVLVPRKPPGAPIIAGAAAEGITHLLSVTNLGSGWDYRLQWVPITAP